MEDYGYPIARATLLEKGRRYLEAAESRLEEGQLEDAVRLFLLHSGDKTGVRRACQCILDGLWHTASLGMAVLPTSMKAHDLIALAAPLESSSLVEIEQDQVRVIFCRCIRRAESFAHSWSYFDLYCQTALRSLRH